MCTYVHNIIQYLYIYISMHVHICSRLIGLSISKCWRCKKTINLISCEPGSFFTIQNQGTCDSRVSIGSDSILRFRSICISNSIRKPAVSEKLWETWNQPKILWMWCVLPTMGQFTVTPLAIFGWEKPPFSEHLSIHQSVLIFGDWFPPCFGG